MELCQSKGTKYEVEYGGKKYNIFYYSHVIDLKQYWTFIN
jgi:hypothetical protein